MGGRYEAACCRTTVGCRHCGRLATGSLASADVLRQPELLCGKQVAPQVPKRLQVHSVVPDACSLVANRTSQSKCCTEPEAGVQHQQLVKRVAVLCTYHCQHLLQH